MLRLAIITAVDYCVLFLLRRSIWGTFDVDRPLVMLKEWPIQYIGSEFLYLLLCLIIAAVSIATMRFALGRKARRQTSVSTSVEFTAAAIMSFAMIYLITISIYRIALGT